MKLLLDTNVVVRLLLGDRDTVPEDVAAALTKTDNQPLVSAASVWEIAIKRSLGKLRIDPGWRTALGSLDLDHLPITADHAALVEHLPVHHPDPFDRLLVAQAVIEDATLVTSDRVLDRYDVPTWWGDR